MQRDFGQLRTRFWSHPKIRPLPRDAKLLALYLLLGPHHSALGCYYCPAGYIQADIYPDLPDLEGRAAFDAALAPLLAVGLVEYDPAQGWVFVPDWLIHNPVKNPNMAKHVEDMFALVSPKVMFYQRLASKLVAHGAHLSQPFKQRLNGVINSSAPEHNGFGIERERGRERDGGRERGTADLPGIESVGETIDRVFATWRQVFNHPRAKLDTARTKAIANALAMGFTEPQIVSAIHGARQAPWVMGQSKNPSYHGKVYDDPGVLFRSAARIEEFMLAGETLQRTGAPPTGDWASRMEADKP